MNYKTVLIDLDDTLIVEEKSAQESFMASAEYLGKFHNIDSEGFINTVRNSARDLWYSLPTIKYAKEIGISSWEALWADFSDTDENQKELKSLRSYYQKTAWRNALLKYGIVDDELALKLSLVYIEDRRNRHILFDDTEIFLKQLSGLNLKIALITNGTPDLQWQKIRKSNIEQYFHTIVISGEIGYKKPGVEIFNYCLKQVNSKKDDSIMIGDSLEKDIRGANNMGITSVWLNRNLKENKTDINPVYEFNNLNDIIYLL